MSLKIGWFTSARGQTSRRLFDAVYSSIRNGDMDAEIAFVFNSREPGESDQTDIFLQMVKAYDIPLACLSYQKYRATHADIAVAKGQPLPQWREDYDRTAMALLDSFEPDICVLAGYMLIVGEEMCQRYRMINLHPAAPDGPTGTWQEVIWKLLEDEAENTGIMMHLITPELDRGPVVTYCTFPIRGREFDKKWEVLEGITSELTKESEGEQNSLFQLIRRHGVMREVPLIISTLKILAEGKLILADGDVRNSLGQSIAGYDLTDEVNYVVRGAFR